VREGEDLIQYNQNVLECPKEKKNDIELTEAGN
jgi:hypothetical protein